MSSQDKGHDDTLFENYELDHIFITTPGNAPSLDRLLQSAGLTEGSPNVHPGQGTSCRRIFFANARLEFLWLTNEEEAKSTPIERTSLYERCNRFDDEEKRSLVSPFGIALRSRDGVINGDYPFVCWEYKPPYIPPGISIPVATNSHNQGEPLLSLMRHGGRPDSFAAHHAQPLDHPGGLKEITSVTLRMPFHKNPISTPLDSLSKSGIVKVVEDVDHVLEITCDHSTQGHQLDCRPDYPIIFYW